MFVVEDQDQPQMIEFMQIYRDYQATCMMQGMEFVLDVVEEEKKGFHLCHQSENLSIAIKVINTILDTAFRIRKNL